MPRRTNDVNVEKYIFVKDQKKKKKKASRTDQYLKQKKWNINHLVAGLVNLRDIGQARCNNCRAMDVEARGFQVATMKFSNNIAMISSSQTFSRQPLQSIHYYIYRQFQWAWVMGETSSKSTI